MWRRVVRWLGFGVLAFGAVTLLSALAAVVQLQTGWGLTALEQCCTRGGTYALALLVSGMFFFLLGAGIVLVSKMGVGADNQRAKPTRWMRMLPTILFVSGWIAIAIATVFAGMSGEFGDATVGIVTYCMLIGVGLLFAGWGLKRAREEK